MDFNSALEEASQHSNVCKSRLTAEAELTKEDLEQFEAALSRKDANGQYAASIPMVMKAFERVTEIKLSATTLSRHRNGTCACVGGIR